MDNEAGLVILNGSILLAVTLCFWVMCFNWKTVSPIRLAKRGSNALTREFSAWSRMLRKKVKKA